MNQATLDLLSWSVVLLPLAGFVVNVFFGTQLPRQANGRPTFASRMVVSVIGCATVFASAVIAWLLFLHVRTAGPFATSPITWIFVPGLGQDNSILSVVAEHKLVVDQLTCVMILVVTNVGFLIHLYSTGYMEKEVRYARYFSYLNLFTGFMLILVMGGNLLLMFVGWEGVGLCSYLLISFWYDKLENAKAGMKAFVVNRIGDFGFTVGVLLLFVYLGTSDFGKWTVDFGEMRDVITKNRELVSTGVMTAVGILLFVGATGKSAQLPLYVWLPDAMAGPTPVSALIHAATMVTAGVYMVARMNFVFALSPVAMTVVATVGGLTALFAGTIGVAQNDIKKVLAYSTVSQLGFMFMGVGVGAFSAGIFHLTTHAFFKACLFLGSGSVILRMHHEQDIRKMGGLRKYMKITFVTFLIASLAISGFPLLAGFWSKDEILWKAFSTHALVIPGWVIWGMGFVAAGFTAFYMMRLVVLTFFGELRSTPVAHHDEETHPGSAHDAGHEEHGHGELPRESPWTMWVPLVVLAALSIVGGFIGMPHWMPGGGVFEQWLAPVCPEVQEVAHAVAEPTHHGPPPTELALMGASVLMGLLGLYAGWRVYHTERGKPAQTFVRQHPELYELVRDKYRVDEAYQGVVVEPLLELNEALGRFDFNVVDGAVNGSASAGAVVSTSTGYFDNEVVDGGVNATGYATLTAGRAMRKWQAGNVKGYLTTAVIGGLVVIAGYCLYMRWPEIHRVLFGS